MCRSMVIYAACSPTSFRFPPVLGLVPCLLIGAANPERPGEKDGVLARHRGGPYVEKTLLSVEWWDSARLSEVIGVTGKCGEGG